MLHKDLILNNEEEFLYLDYAMSSNLSKRELNEDVSSNGKTKTNEDIG
jgi:hypothetical protein